jgi:hypothetical protein
MLVPTGRVPSHPGSNAGKSVLGEGVASFAESTIWAGLWERNFRRSVRIGRSHPTKPPQQQYDALVDNHLLSIGQFSYHFSLRHSRRRDAAQI